jgi:phosphoglycolate phosphatase
MRYGLCLFDLDGTLTDSAPSILGSVKYTAEKFGIELNNLNELTRFIGPPLRSVFRDAIGLTEDIMEEAVAVYRKYYSEKGIYETVVYPGIIPLLERLKSDGVKLAVATSKVRAYAGTIAEFAGFRHYFDFIAGCELDGTRERKSELIGYVFDNIDPERGMRAIMIGDREHDIIGANEAGIDSAGILWGYGSRKELEENGATYLVETTEDLYKILRGE